MNTFAHLDFETLRAIPELKEVPDEQLLWFLDNSTFRTLSKGEDLFVPEMTVDHLYIILEGTLEMISLKQENKKVLFQFRQGEILGHLPYSNFHTSPVLVKACTDVRLCCYPKSAIRGICENYELTNALVQVMLLKVKNLSTNTLQNEKMLALGKLTAGLSHELNNPITSIQREAADLQRLFETGPLLNLIICCAGVADEEKSQMRQSLLAWKQSRRRADMKPSEIQDLEVAWSAQLTQWGMHEPEEAAEAFTDAGIDFEEVSYWVEKINPQTIHDWLHGVQHFIQSQAIVSAIQKATERVKSLTRAVKTFTHVNREPIRAPLNLVHGIEDTLIILSHKLRAAKVDIALHKPERPVIMVGFAAELNQVWTNLIDNAIDALNGTTSPKLDISISTEDSLIKVTITDNGPGVPEEIRSRIFEPFFTTKGIGIGTGMGLDLVTQIVAKHRGKIRLDSVPGKTSFHLEFPKS
jgi:signal transduction histidine kinase